MINILSGFFNNGIIQVLLLLLIFAGVALLANFIRKLLWPQSLDAEKIDPKKAVKEELDRVLVPLETPLTPKEKTASAPKAKKPSTTTSKKKANAKRAKRAS